jgi:hypothetical protein
MTQSKARTGLEKIEQLLNLESLLLQRFCRLCTTDQAGRLIRVNHFKYISSGNYYNFFDSLPLLFMGKLTIKII